MGSGRSTRGFALLAALSFASAAVHGQDAPKRLSDWLLEQPLPPNAYLLGLSWRVPGEEAAQRRLRDELLAALLDEPGLKNAADAAALRALHDWIRTLPVTGRVPVALADARWLQVNPPRDPLLLPGHAVTVPTRPQTVTVITEQGERCAVTHASGREAMAYVEACGPARNADSRTRESDWVWIAQPDGRVQRFGVAGWNRETQDEPAPGAWIWAPSRSSGYRDRLAERLVQFLATQGPAADPPGGAIALPSSSAFATRSRSAAVSASDWGSTGLLQTPTARMPATGTLTVNVSHVWPYTHGNVFVQPLDWLEVGFRYTDTANRLYGPQNLSGNQNSKDKSFDAKFRLWRESAFLPDVAVGFRDLAGTGLFAGEYVVGSKRFGALDWSLGMGWGYVGGRGNLRNPLRLFGSKFEKREVDSGQGGDFSPRSYFRGRTALFGGVQYQTPWERLALKLELDGNNYQHEPLDNNQRNSSPLNFGLAWRASRGVDLSLGVERGNRLMLGFALHSRLDEAYTPKLSDPPRVPVTLNPAPPPPQADWSATGREIERQTGWRVGRIEQAGRELRVTLLDARAGYWGERVDRAAAVLNRDAPPEVERFTLAYRQAGTVIAEHVIERDAWVTERTRPVPPHERREAVIARAPQPAPATAPLFEQARPRFEHGLGLDFQYILGGPDAFALFQLSAAERMRLWLRDDTWIRGVLRLGLVDNYDRFKFNPPSDLPRVRTFQREYVTTSTFTMPVMQLTHAGKLSDRNYYSVYGGYFEEMFGGVGTEWLYRPFAGRSAFGVDLNYVGQRDFAQNFQFRDYRVATGHATAYLDTGWNDILATVSAGRYLAGDKGATLQLSRVFRNGMTVGAWATRTSAGARFGEGSFDKGVFLAIPFDAILTRSSPSTGYIVWNPLTRDGGAMLVRADPLYSVTDVRDPRALWVKPAAKPDDQSIPADRREAWRPESR